VNAIAFKVYLLIKSQRVQMDMDPIKPLSSGAEWNSYKMPGALAAEAPAFRNRYWLIAQGSAASSLHSYISAAVAGACLAYRPG